MTSEVRGKRAKQPRAQRFNDAQFVRYELGADEKKRMKEHFWPEFDAGTALDRLSEAGYSVKVKYDDFSSAYAAFIQRCDGKQRNAGLILTGRGSKATTALCEACFKHYVLFEDDWPVPASRAEIEAWDSDL